MSINPNLLLVANSNLLTLSGLKNQLAGEFVNTALVVATLTNPDGTDVAGQVWPVTLDYVADSDGDYRVALAADLVLMAGKRYAITVACQGDGLTFNTTDFIKAINR